MKKHSKNDGLGVPRPKRAGSASASSSPKKAERPATSSRKPDMDKWDSKAILMKAFGALDADQVLQELKHLALSMHIMSAAQSKLAELNSRRMDELSAKIDALATPTRKK